jgi:hypothetical protein
MVMARLGSILFIPLLLLVASGVASAQDSAIRDPLVIREYWMLSRCAAENAPDEMARLLQDFDWGKSQVSTVLKTVSIYDSCGASGARDKHMDATLMRGMIASEVFLTQHKDNALPNYSAVPDNGRDRVLSMSGKHFFDMREVLQRTSRLRFFGFGECVFHAMPEMVRDLLMTEPATPQENQKIKELSATMSYCLRNGVGGDVIIPRMLMRSSLGEGAYSVDKELASLRPSEKR